MRSVTWSRTVLILGTLLVVAAARPSAGQLPGPPADLSALKQFTPIGPPANLAPSAVPDLSGAWVRAGGLQSVSQADPLANLRGKEPDIPYQPWALARTMAEVPPTGPFGEPHRTTDPWIRYCEPNGPFRIFMHPGRMTFVPLQDRVLVLYEVMQQFRIVRLNSQHPPLEDLDPTWWGDSIGWFENGDTFVIDTIGTNGRTWLSQQGHPTTTRLHVVERYRRVNADSMTASFIIDDPGAYTKAFETRINLRRSPVPFMQSPWNCSVRDNQAFTDQLLKDAVQ